MLGLVAGVFLVLGDRRSSPVRPGETELRRSVQRSTILSEINDVFPPERLLEELERVDRSGCSSAPAIVAPPEGLAKDPDVVRASKSVVRVTGIACGLGLEGSGWVVKPGLVVTNAHVVAGIERPRVVRPAGGRSRRRSSHSTSRTTSPCCALRASARAPFVASAERGVPVALVGYPRNGPLTRTPARLGGTADVLSRDAYGRGPVRRQVTAIRGVVEPGSSGGPGIDAQGRVRTTVFARRPRETGGYASRSSWFEGDLPSALRPSRDGLHELIPPRVDARDAEVARIPDALKRSERGVRLPEWRDHVDARGQLARPRRARARSRGPCPCHPLPRPAVAVACSGTTIPGTSLWRRSASE